MSGDVAQKAGKMQTLSHVQFWMDGWMSLFLIIHLVFAVGHKNFLESETGLKVLQSRVGEVGGGVQ